MVLFIYYYLHCVLAEGEKVLRSRTDLFGIYFSTMAEGLLSLAWNNHMSTFSHMLSIIRDVARYADVTIACDGKLYPAHKLVLSTCSDYFLKMFEMTSCKHPVIVIKDVKCKNMEALLNYMYAGVVNVSQSDLPHLIRAAELLEIKGLAVADEPPTENKRPSATRDTSMSHNSPNPKRPRIDEKRPSNQGQTQTPPAVISSPVASSQSSPLRRDGSQEECVNGYDVYEKVNQRQTQSEQRLQRKDSQSCSRSESLENKYGLDHWNTARESENEVASDCGIKEEKVELENEREATDMGYEYDSLMTDLIGAGGGESKEHSTSLESFNPSLNEETYTSEAGPSGLQTWPILEEGGESTNQNYPGGLPLVSHPGQQPLQMQHMVMESSDLDSRGTGTGLKSSKMHHCPYCPYTAEFNYLLLRHIRTHTGEKPYWCPHCSYRASRKDSLKQHMATHTPLTKTE